MKLKNVSLVSVFLLGTTALFAQTKTDEFKVYGNCGMCEKRIETAAKSVDGVTAADWDKTTKMIEVTYDSTKTDGQQIEMAIAKVGHDTEMYRSEEKVYDDLPGCCQYDRPAAIKPKKDDGGQKQ